MKALLTAQQIQQGQTATMRAGIDADEHGRLFKPVHVKTLVFFGPQGEPKAGGGHGGFLL